MQSRAFQQKIKQCILAQCVSRFFRKANFGAVFFTFFASLVGAAAQSAADSAVKMPAARQPRPRLLDVQHIALDLRFELEKKQALGTATITLAPLFSTEKIALDAGFLDIHAVKTADGKLLKFEYDGSDRDENLLILLDRRLKKGEIFTLQIDYQTRHVNRSDPNNLWGSFGRGLRFFEPTATEPRKRRQIWSVGEPTGNRYWFPGHDAPGDLRTCEIRTTVGLPLRAISNGKLVETRPNADSSRTFHWRMDVPIANHQTSIVVGEFDEFVQRAEGIELRSFGYPDEMDAVRATVVRLPAMLRFFEKTTGTKFPYFAYNQVFVQDFPWGGGPGAGTSTISENMVDDHPTHADFFYLWDGVEAQDLAAQWFGNLVSVGDWSDVWLARALPFHLDGLFSEAINGRDEVQLWNRQFQLTTCLGDWQSGIRRPIVTRHFDDAETMCRDNFGLRGALILQLLRKQLGEDKWLKTIQLFVKKHAGGTVTTDDLQRAAEQVTGEKLDWFFEQWLKKMGHPKFEISKKYDAKRRQLVLDVRQAQKIDPKNEFPQVEFFQGKLEIELDGGRIEQVWIEPKLENRFVFDAATEQRLVNFDFENSWIREIKFEKTADEWLFQLENSRDILARRTAIVELAQIFNNEKTDAALKNQILAAFRRTVLGNSYWRLRSTALLTLQNLLSAKPLDEPTEAMLFTVLKNEKSWLRAGALTFLGTARDPRHAPVFIENLRDSSDRVVNAAAIALGKSRAPDAFERLSRLPERPSWKNQSLISALNGLRELGDPRAVPIALAALRDSAAAPRWNLANSTWDFRLAAAETLVALGKAAEGYPIVYQRFVQSLAEDDWNDIFGNALLIVTLGDPRGREIFAPLRLKFRSDANALQAIQQFENQLK